MVQKLDRVIAEGSGDYSRGVGLISGKIEMLIGHVNANGGDRNSVTMMSIEILDDLARSEAFFRRLSDVEQGGNRVVHNYTLVLRTQLIAFLKRLGVEEIPCSGGDDFVPEIHNAVALSVDGRYRKETVVDIIRAGYRFIRGMIIRFVDVIVGRAPRNE